jgi:hypothetical protein
LEAIEKIMEEKETIELIDKEIEATTLIGENDLARSKNLRDI